MIDSIGSFLANAEHIYLFIAIFGSVFLIIQLISSLFGGDFECHDGEIGANECSDIDGLKFLSVKGIVSFITFFGWAGYFWGSTGFLGFFIAVGCGLFMMFLTALVLFFLLKMQQSGNFNSEDFIGQTGVVYLSIPADRKPGGQAIVALKQYCTRKIAVVADKEIKSGGSIKVIKAINESLFLVEEDVN